MAIGELDRWQNSNFEWDGNGRARESRRLNLFILANKCQYKMKFFVNIYSCQTDAIILLLV